MLAVCFGAVRRSPAQSVQPASETQIQQSPIPAENLWRKEAVNLATQTDTVTPEIRKARDAYWNLVFPLQTGRNRTTIPNNGGIYVSTDNTPPKEFPGIQNHQWIIGRFESSHVYQTSKRGGLYTEINMRVQHVFSTQHQMGLAEGQLIDIALRGGAVIDNQSNRIDFLNANERPQMQPGHVYLISVEPCQQRFNCTIGNFYFPESTFDITSGVVQPVDYADSVYAATGGSKLTGTPASTIIPRFQQILDQAAQDDAK